MKAVAACLQPAWRRCCSCSRPRLLTLFCCAQTKPRSGKRQKRNNEGGIGSGDEAAEELVPGALGSRILREARVQQEEIDAERAPGGGVALRAGAPLAAAATAHDSDSEDDGGDGWSDGGGSVWGDLGGELEEVSPEDEAALAAFMAPGATDYRQRTLADLVVERIRQKQGGAGIAELPR